MACTLLLLLQSCKKEIFEAANKKPIAEDLKWATDYYQQKLELNKNLLVMPTKAISTEGTTNKGRTNKMTVLWELAYSSKTSLSESVEVPVNIDGKLMPTFIVTKDPKTKPVLDLEIINASLNRVYIYKDKDGNINQNLITYVPDKDYLKKQNGNISHNHVDKIDNDFFGYLQYKDWDGNVLFVLRIENGKSVRRIETSNSVLIDETIKQNGNLPIDDQKQTNNYQLATCDEWTIRYEWEQWCYYQGSSQIPTSCDPPEISNAHITPNCPGMGGGGGTTTPTRDIRNKTTDPCIFKTVEEFLAANKDIEGAMSDIVKNFDASKAVKINVFDGHISTPGQTTNQQFIGNNFSAKITLSIDYHANTSKENMIATMIHEVLHAYLGFSSNNFLKTEPDHNVIAEKYITPMASYLTQYFGMQIKDAYALAWSGVPDSKVFEDANDDVEFTMSDGNKITKAETRNLSGPYKLSTNDPANNGYTKGTKICN